MTLTPDWRQLQHWRWLQRKPVETAAAPFFHLANWYIEKFQRKATFALQKRLTASANKMLHH
jgi:hypothetical protein